MAITLMDLHICPDGAYK